MDENNMDQQFNQPYQQFGQQYQQFGQQNQQFGQPYQQPYGQPMMQQPVISEATSIGGWIGWLFLGSVIPPIGSIIVACTANDPSVKNWAKANIVLQIIAVVLIIAFWGAFASFISHID